jgi:hypothetical protein
MLTPTIHALDDRHTLATWRNVVIGAWLRLPEASEVDACRRLLMRLAAANPRGIGYLHLSAPHDHEDERRPISDDARAAFARVVSGIDGLHCIGVVVRAKGFSSAIVRGTFTRMLLAARSNVLNLSFEDVPSAASWMEHELGLVRDGIAAPGALAAAAEAVDAGVVAHASSRAVGLRSA